ncbi:hypothetical protein GCM10022221_28360 [Actinocorallia aurea]
MKERLRADPSILGRWDCAPGWCTAWIAEFDMARLTFDYPSRTTSSQAPSVQFEVVIDVGGRAPEEVADEVVGFLLADDPKATAEIVGGTPDGPERLGLLRR